MNTQNTQECKVTSHTPTPWKDDGWDERTGIIIQSEWGEVARVNGNEKYGNAAFIVRACNAHEELLCACKVAEDFIYQAGLHGYDPHKANLTIAKLLIAIYNATPEGVGAKAEL